MTTGTQDCLFAAMRSVTNNVGEEVQWLAAERFLPRIDMLANKERMTDLNPIKCTKLIMNGFYTRRVKKFIPGNNVEPLLTSMHIWPECYGAFSKGKIREFLVKYGPVGCRDEATHKFLESKGIPSYFSGCLSLTLQRNPAIQPNGYVVCVGLWDEEVAVIAKRTSRKVISINRLMPMIYSHETRMNIARAFLALYQGAHCVITKMFHVAIPCLALGTPCLHVELNPQKRENHIWRFDGYLDLINHIPREKLMSGDFPWDFDKILPSPLPPNEEAQRKFKVLRDDLVEKCSSFTGYDRGASMLTITDPFPYLLRVMTWPKYYEPEQWRTLYSVPFSKLLKAVWNRGIMRKTEYDLQ